MDYNCADANGGLTMDDRDGTSQGNPEAAQRAPAEKRQYRSPLLTEYGSVEDLVDTGVVGSTIGTVPSIT
jgi:hypothetical protein